MGLRRCAILALFVAGCSGCAGMSEREQRTLTGGAIGAGGGAVLSGISGGRPAVGAALGGAAGALTGYILGDRNARHRR
ncbi:lipoprotein, putative [Citrifermentans bemidjiense Bem]|uniref:Lipoprotein, putative n=1 Tax=Citrifermentans bemidjiense (strain ATCC BAA-1014 / DSM 16622 / JCM 12645 / Bem) TaxID=404380 RepID=B5E9L0_CITBB|nr:YMGG-like glycine zipper-containing protein [Citrifermentans bemidjiense]ACH40184.1 lipoprotein, putative [Citrifermentans bemidjiense Bem]